MDKFVAHKIMIMFEICREVRSREEKNFRNIWGFIFFLFQLDEEKAKGNSFWRSPHPSSGVLAPSHT